MHLHIKIKFSWSLLIKAQLVATNKPKLYLKTKNHFWLIERGFTTVKW